MAHMIPSLKLYRQLMAEASAPPAAEVTAAQPSASVRPPSHTPLATKLPVLTCLAGWAGATAFRAGAGAHGDVRAGARARGVSHTTRTLKCECELNNNCVTEQAPAFRTVPCQPASHRHLLSTRAQVHGHCTLWTWMATSALSSLVLVAATCDPARGDRRSPLARPSR